MFSPGILQLMLPSPSASSVIPEFLRRVAKNEHIIRGNDPPFRLAATKKRGGGLLSLQWKKNEPEEDAMEENGEKIMVAGGGGTKTEVFLSPGMRAEDQRVKRGERRRIRRKRTGRTEKRKESEPRDPPAKGSYYNKFVGGLRSGNNSELRVTLRMCLSLLLFK